MRIARGSNTISDSKEQPLNRHVLRRQLTRQVGDIGRTPEQFQQPDFGDGPIKESYRYPRLVKQVVLRVLHRPCTSIPFSSE